MAQFQPGNKFWQRRNKHGRDKLFASPELLWEAACEYFEWADNNPWMKREAIKSGDMVGTILEIPTERPYTLHALCLYLGCNTAYFRSFKAQERAEKGDFSTVITAIEETIYNQKFEGASIGAFNSNIIARDLGLSDKQEMTGKDGAALIPTGIKHVVEFRDMGAAQGDAT